MPDLTSHCLESMKWAFTTRRICKDQFLHLSGNIQDVRPGDVICAEVETLGQHNGVQLAQGRRAEIYPGDRLALCVGSRYAPDQFEGEPKIVDGHCHLVAAGGIAGMVTNANASMKSPTGLKVLGVLKDASGENVNIRDYALPVQEPGPHGPVFAVFGSSMNAGKTTTAACLVHGLTKSGFKVGAGKVTGTGAFGDYFRMSDAGAIKVLDFTDFGYATTVGVQSHRICQIAAGLIGNLTRAGATAIVLEIADGILQDETGKLAQCPSFGRMVDAVLFAGADAMGTVAGVNALRAAGLALFAISGKISSSPLGCREIASQVNAPVLTCNQLQNPDDLSPVLAQHRLASENGDLIYALQKSIAA